MNCRDLPLSLRLSCPFPNGTKKDLCCLLRGTERGFRADTDSLLAAQCSDDLCYGDDSQSTVGITRPATEVGGRIQYMYFTVDIGSLLTDINLPISYRSPYRCCLAWRLTQQELWARGNKLFFIVMFLVPLYLAVGWSHGTREFMHSEMISRATLA
jgi:hypothetical protein